MSRILFASDLDNTLLFSYKHRQAGDQCVELLDGREQGFCTGRSLELLAQLGEQVLFIPVTTRSAAQYQRISWPAECRPSLAVTTNGGLLLVDGKIDEEWRTQTEQLAAPWRRQLLELYGRVQAYPAPKRCRLVDDIYLFAACDDREAAEALGAAFAGSTSLETAVSGRKVYFFPPPVNKGTALERLKARLSSGDIANNKYAEIELTICAGDSIIDLPMLRLADLALVPESLLLPEGGRGEARSFKGEGRFAEFVLENVLNEAAALVGQPEP